MKMQNAQEEKFLWKGSEIDAVGKAFQAADSNLIGNNRKGLGRSFDRVASYIESIQKSDSQSVLSVFVPACHSRRIHEEFRSVTNRLATHFVTRSEASIAFI